MNYGADDERARTIMEHELIMRRHAVHLVKCDTKDDVERYVYEAGQEPGYATVDMLDATWYAATVRMYHDMAGQHILDGVYGVHG